LNRKKGRQNDATAREKPTPTSTEKTQTQPTLLSHAPAARCNQDQDARRAAAAATHHAQRRNAQSKGEATKTYRRVRSHSKMELKEGRHHDATAREKFLSSVEWKKEFSSLTIFCRRMDERN
jgi:hypothetical protein